jgi:hypothetical protein
MTALQKIQLEAKKIRKSKPNIKYTDAIKLASVKYNAGKLGAASKVAPNKKASTKVTPKKKASPKLPVKKIVTTVTKEKMSGLNIATYITLESVFMELELLQQKSKNLQLSAIHRNNCKKQFTALKGYLNTKAKFV